MTGEDIFGDDNGDIDDDGEVCTIHVYKYKINFIKFNNVII